MDFEQESTLLTYILMTYQLDPKLKLLCHRLRTNFHF